MICWLFLLPLLLMAFADPLQTVRESAGPGASKRTDRIRILNWNINRGGKLASVEKALTQEQPDLCILQEVDLNARRTKHQDVALKLAEQRGYHASFAAAFEELGQGSEENPAYHGQATLSRLPVRSSRLLRFEHQSSFWQPRSYLPSWGVLQRRRGGRVALVSELDFAGTTLVVYNLHLESRSTGGMQRMQLEEVMADLQRYPAGTPVVLAGDLNTKYNPAAMRRWLETQDFHSCFGDQLVRTHHIAGWLDWIFVRGPLRCEDPQVLRGLRGSDHDALAAWVQWEAKR